VLIEIKRYFNSTDPRGSIQGLINFGNWKEINLIKSKSGVIRGKHYHSHTREAFIILKGKIRIKVQHVSENKLVGQFETHLVSSEMVFVIEPNTYHEFEVLENSSWINLLSRRLDPNNLDIIRLQE
jgi:dTDP-4-dehydrorhamnose 3,5-epimerase-like enzyme